MEMQINVDNQIYYFSIINGQITNIYRKDNSNNKIELSKSEMQAMFEKITNNLNINNNLINIYEQIKKLIESGQINSFEGLQNYYKIQGYTQEQINELNAMFKDQFNSKDIPNKSEEYENDYNTIIKYLDKKREQFENLIIDFTLEENKIISLKVFEYDSEKKSTNSVIEKKYDYNENLKNSLINPLIKHTSENKKVATEVKTKADVMGMSADFYMKNDENVLLNVKDVEEYYANNLQKLANNPNLSKEDLENNNEKEKKEEKGYQRVLAKPNNNIPNGYINMKTFIGLLIFAFIVTILITILIK